mgnify:CR=1 FL=1
MIDRSKLPNTFEFVVTAGARAPDVDYVLASPDAGKRELGTYRPVTPMLGIIGRVYAGKVSIEGSGATFATISGRKSVEAEIGARIHLSDRLALSGGYRYLSFKATAKGDVGDRERDAEGGADGDRVA